MSDTQAAPSHPVRVAYGKVTFPASSGSLACLTVDPPFYKKFTSFSMLPSSMSYPASSRPDIHGRILSYWPVSFPVGTLIMLQAQHTVSGLRVRDSAIFLRLRNGAPLLTVSYLTPVSPLSYFVDNKVVAFAGEADLLTHEQIRDIGFVPPASFVSNYCNEDERDELFLIDVIREELVPMPVYQEVVNLKGETVLVQKPALPRRMIRLPRK